MRSSPRFATVVVVLCGVFALGALVHRLRFSADLSDEAFSIALPYRFALGDRPFIDEVSTAQTAGLLLLPFVWLFVKLTGGSAGIVLFVRFVHLFIKAIAAMAVHSAVFADLEAIMSKYDRHGGRLLVVYESPGCYLFSKMRPSSNTVWPLSYFGQPELLAYWRQHVTGKGIVVMVGAPQRNVVDPVVAVAERQLEQRRPFTVYAEP